MVDTCYHFYHLIDIIDHVDNFYTELKKNDYQLLETIILDNNVEVLKYSLKALEEKNDSDYLKLFTPGFFRNEKILKRQLPSYLMLVSKKETKKVLMTYSKTRNSILTYWNDNIILEN